MKEYALIKNNENNLYHFFVAKTDKYGRTYVTGKSLCSIYDLWDNKIYVNKTYSGIKMNAYATYKSKFFSESTEDISIINSVSKVEELPKNFCKRCGPMV